MHRHAAAAELIRWFQASDGCTRCYCSTQLLRHPATTAPNHYGTQSLPHAVLNGAGCERISKDWGWGGRSD